ncbi:flavin monoamine oxidase family protein [Paracoccus sp. 08]|uniref:flavin monoamine oxidase family protein n=1 Tax=Paracoccus sp. 08 TaxID=2606624 RepID=UPI0020960F53|nr:flavin monoamine oxidase family protein [Paracoccus sp. 08]MCO6362287.1 NAD(P)-binding protein [Paracoccus sp. 08]
MTFNSDGISRRSLLSMIGAVAGAGAMYGAMSTMGLAQGSTYAGRLDLQGSVNGTRVLVLGAGLAGMTAAYELRAAGYQVKVLEFREKAGGRCWTLRGGDRYTELGGDTQDVTFSEGNYLNPGPWRIPSDHYAVLDYCKRFGVKLEPFIQVNYNAYLHNTAAFDGQPQRFKEISTDFRGHVAELLAKVVDQQALDADVTEADAQLLMDALKRYGALNDDMAYVTGEASSAYRGWAVPEGGGTTGKPEPSEIHPLSVILQSNLWRNLTAGDNLHMQSTIFQPVGGMDQIAQAFEREVGDLITFQAKVTRIRHEGDTVTATWVPADGGEEQTETADYCICTIPFSILGQIDHDFSARMSGIIDGMYYASSFKCGLEFKRRFWEQDDHIYGGISYTNLPISLISYPSTDYFSDGPGVLLAAYSWGASSYQFNALPPSDRIEAVLDYGSQIHPQYRDEFVSGVSVGWHKVPWVRGCYGIWKDRDADYMDATTMDGRTLMAGEHISYLPAWMEGAILSALDAVQRLHVTVTES